MPKGSGMGPCKSQSPFNETAPLGIRTNTSGSARGSAPRNRNLYKLLANKTLFQAMAWIKQQPMRHIRRTFNFDP